MSGIWGVWWTKVQRSIGENSWFTLNIGTFVLNLWWGIYVEKLVKFTYNLVQRLLYRCVALLLILHEGVQGTPNTIHFDRSGILLQITVLGC